MKKKIRKKHRIRFVLTALFVFTLLFGLPNFETHAELKLEPNSKDDDVYTLCIYGEESSVDAYARQGGVSTGKLEELLNDGYCLQYLDSWKSAGLIPSDFVPASQKSGSSSTSSGNDTSSSNNTSNDSSVANSTKTYTDEEIANAWELVTTVDPTCTTDGYKEYKNSLTGKTKTEAIAATGEHTYEVTDSTDATCTEKGSVTYTCSACGDTYTEETDMLEHTYEVTDTKDATCTEDGYTKYECTACGDSYEETTKATGHDDGAWVVTKEAGAFTTGTKELKCTVCGEVLDTATIPQTCPIPLAGVVAIIVIACGVVGGVIVVAVRKKKIV